MRSTLSHCLTLLLLATSGAAAASWTVSYDGPDELLIVGRPNTAGSNIVRASLHLRPLPSGRLSQLLAPIVATALEGCSMDGVRRIAITPMSSPDHIGETMARIQGLGLYLNLPLANRVSYGNFYLAPFFAITVSLQGDNGPLQSVDLLDYNKALLEQPPLTEDGFLAVRTEDLEASIVAFAKTRLPGDLRKALSARCPAA